jgi:hypothetical protein
VTGQRQPRFHLPARAQKQPACASFPGSPILRPAAQIGGSGSLHWSRTVTEMYGLFVFRLAAWTCHAEVLPVEP